MDIKKLEEDRKQAIGNWQDRNFINKLEVMLENSTFYDKLTDVVDYTDTANKYKIIEVLGKVLCLAKSVKMTAEEVFSMYLVLGWSKKDESK